MFADGVIESSSTMGTGTYTLVQAEGAALRFQQAFADGKEVGFWAQAKDRTKWEKGTGILTYGPPCTLTRASIKKSSNAGAAIDWQVGDDYLVYSVADADALAGVITGNLATTTRPWWVRAGARWMDYTAGLAVSWFDTLATGAATDSRVGYYDVVKDVYFPDSRRPSVAVGAANKTVLANEIGVCFSYNTTAGARTVTLPLGSTVKDGFTTSHIGLDIANGLIFTPNASDGIEGGADGVTLTVPGKVPVSMRWDAARDTWASSYVPAQAPNWAGRRQTVAAGRVDTAGLPALLPTSSVSLNLTTDLNSVTLVVASANGWLSANGRPNDLVGYTATNFTWLGLAASRAAATPNYLYVIVNADGTLTPGSTTVAPIEQEGGVPSTAPGQITFNRSEMKCYLGNGATAPQTNLVVVGEAATDGSTVLSTVAYVHNGRYDSGFTNTLPSLATFTSKNHNIGVKPRVAKLVIENITTELGFAVGDQVTEGHMTAYSTAFVPLPIISTTKTVGFQTGASAGLLLLERTTGNATPLTAANWKYKVTADRGWG